MSAKSFLISFLLLAGGLATGVRAQSPAPEKTPVEAKAALVADIVKTATEVLRTATESKREPAVIQAGITAAVSYVVRAAVTRGVDREVAGEAVRTVRTDPSLHLDPLIIKSMGPIQATYPVMPAPAAPVQPTAASAP